MSDEESIENPLFPPPPKLVKRRVVSVNNDFGCASLSTAPQRTRNAFRRRFPGESDSEYNGDWIIFVFQQNYRTVLLVIACFLCVMAILLSADVSRAKMPPRVQSIVNRTDVACTTAVARSALCTVSSDDCEAVAIVCDNNSTVRVFEPSECTNSECLSPCDWLAIYNSSAPLAPSRRWKSTDTNLHAPLGDIGLDGTRGTLRWLMTRAELFLDAAREEECCCAPMFGARFSHVTVRNDNDSAPHVHPYLHMFGLMDSAWEAYDTLSTNSSSYDVELLGALSVVKHHGTSAFFDLRYASERNSTVHVARRDVLRLMRMERRGVPRGVTLTGEVAYCVALCYDLIAGISVFERASRQQSLGIEQPSTLNVELALRQINTPV